MSFDLSIPADVVAAAEEMTKGGFSLTVPPLAEDERKKGYARWDEYATIEGAHRESVGENGENVVNFVLQMKIIPFNDSPNGGRKYTDFNRINYSAMAEDGKTDAARLAGQKTMSNISIKKIKQLTAIAELSLEAGITQEILDLMFPAAESSDDIMQESALIGKVVTINMMDNSNKKRNGANTQNLEGFAPGPEGL